jgi:A118 family predicted phage portal protein
MPLPDTNQDWPPEQHRLVHDHVRVWSAWYESSPEQLAAVYGGAHPLSTTGSSFYASQQGGWTPRPSQFAGGVIGAVSRFWWGQPHTSPGARPAKLHVPAAADIATTSANLLFGEPPDITVEQDQTAQDRLEELFDEDTWAQLVTAAEVAAGLGGVYVRVGWDQDVADKPLLSVVGPDCACPTFRWGRLSEVTFSWVVRRDESGVLRKLELHGVDGGVGFVEHGLYMGDDDKLGHQLPLNHSEATEALADLVDEQGRIVTGLDRLDVIYVPNQRARSWRNHQTASAQGQPDIAGVEPLLDAFDETYSSWMRDIRLGKARLVVPQSYLDNLGPGKGGMFDVDREVFVGVEALPGAQGMLITESQFAIRHAEHAATAAALLERIVTGCGYSAQTFGLTGEVAMTATEAHARERKTVQTRAGKIRHWRAALADLAEILLGIDSHVFGGRVNPVRPDVEWPSYASDSPEQLARTAQLLNQAEAASTETLVRSVHGEWDDEQVQAEVQRIAAERNSGPQTQVEVDQFADEDEEEPVEGEE